MAAVTGESLKSELEVFDITCEDDFVLDKSKLTISTLVLVLKFHVLARYFGSDQL